MPCLGSGLGLEMCFLLPKVRDSVLKTVDRQRQPGTRPTTLPSELESFDLGPWTKRKDNTQANMHVTVLGSDPKSRK